MRSVVYVEQKKLRGHGGQREFELEGSGTHENKARPSVKYSTDASIAVQSRC